MKNLGATLLVGLLLMVGLSAFLLWGPLGQRPGMRVVYDETGQPITATSPPTEAAERKPESSRTRAAAPKEIATLTEIPAVPEPAAADPLRPPRVLPTAAEISIGMEKSYLHAAFGKPTMTTTVVDRGRLLETYVYLQADPNIATFVLLRNGRVVSANTTVY